MRGLLKETVHGVQVIKKDGRPRQASIKGGREEKNGGNGSVKVGLLCQSWESGGLERGAARTRPATTVSRKSEIATTAMEAPVAVP